VDGGGAGGARGEGGQAAPDGGGAAEGAAEAGVDLSGLSMLAGVGQQQLAAMLMRLQAGAGAGGEVQAGAGRGGAALTNGAAGGDGGPPPPVQREVSGLWTSIACGASPCALPPRGGAPRALGSRCIRRAPRRRRQSLSGPS